MFERDIYTIHSTYREDMHIKGFQFGKGEKSACIVGAARGNEIISAPDPRYQTSSNRE